MFSKQVVSSVTLYGYKQIDDSLSIEHDSFEERDNKTQVQLPDMSSSVNVQVEGHISQLSMGQSHVLLLTDGERVQTIGSNQFGQRGASASNALTPTLVKEVEGVVQVSCGLYHSVCLDRQKKVHTWGRGSEGQLGIGDVDFQQEPSTLTLNGVASICCGGSHTLFLTEEGQVFACGDDSWGQLGLGSQHSIRQRPTKLESLMEGAVKISQIQAGLEHSLFMSTEGLVYACGNNLFSQCGLEGVSNVNRPTVVQIPLSQGENVTNIYASMGTFSAVLTSRNNIFIWGTGSWGHARKPTNIQELCHFEGIPKFSSLIMGDNYALIHDIKQYLILGSNKLPDLGSQSPIQKLRCEVLRIPGCPLKVQLGFKMMLVIDKECTQTASRRYSAQTEVKTETPASNMVYQKIVQARPSSSQHSQRSIMMEQKAQEQRTQELKAQDLKSEQLQKSLSQAQNDVTTLKQELEFCKSQMRQKDQLILELQTSIQKHQNSQPQPSSQQHVENPRHSNHRQVTKEHTPKPSPKPSPIRQRDERRQPSPMTLKEERRPSISISKVEAKAQPYTPINENFLYVPQPHSNYQASYGIPNPAAPSVPNHRDTYNASICSIANHPSHMFSSNHQNLDSAPKKPFRASDSSHYPAERKSLALSTDVYKSNKPLQPTNTIGSTFEYKTYEKLRMMSNNALESDKKEENPETRIKKLDEGSFSLSRYNMKSIRSITPYDLRNFTPYQSNSSVSELKKSNVGNYGNEANGFKSYERRVEVERSATPECQAQPTEVCHKRTHTNTNDRFYRDTYTPVPQTSSGIQDGDKHQINTSIIDKICNYQRVVGNYDPSSLVSKIVNGNPSATKPEEKSSSIKFSIQERSDKKQKQSPYTFKGHSNCDVSYVEQFSSVCQTQEPNQSYENITHYLNKQYEDFYKLRG